MPHTSPHGRVYGVSENLSVGHRKWLRQLFSVWRVRVEVWRVRVEVWRVCVEVWRVCVATVFLTRKVNYE